jgi:hypothetical protein
MREPEMVVVPKGAKNESTGVRLKRKAIKFYPNHQGQGQLITSDEKVQELLDNHPWMKSGKLVCMGAHNVVPAPDHENDAPEQTQAAGPATSEPKVKGKGKK